MKKSQQPTPKDTQLAAEWRKKYRGIKTLQDWLKKAEDFCKSHGLPPL